MILLCPNTMKMQGYTNKNNGNNNKNDLQIIFLTQKCISSHQTINLKLHKQNCSLMIPLTCPKLATACFKYYLWERKWKFCGIYYLQVRRTLQSSVWIDEEVGPGSNTRLCHKHISSNMVYTCPQIWCKHINKHGVNMLSNSM